MTSWSWVKSANPSAHRIPPPVCFPYEVDEDAAYNAFVCHWKQILDILRRSKQKGNVSSDEVTAILNHLGQMVNLLLVDVQQMVKESNGHTVPSDCSTDHPLGTNSHEKSNGVLKCSKSLHTPIFDHFVGERVLETLLEWSVSSGKEYMSAMQLELLKVYETLLSNSHPEILVYKPITEPLNKLLEITSSFVPVEVEKRLVVLLNQLWVSLMHNQHLLNYFIKEQENQTPKFLIFSLLLPFIHREGIIGQQSRDTLLLSMSISTSHPRLSDYILNHSNFCPVLAAGLSGLYSMLPRTLFIKTEGWYRISPEDVASSSALQLFLSSLDFCNAIVQSSHSTIQDQLVEYLYQGFLVPVVGPALMQMNVVEEVIASMAYMEFFVQSVSEEKLRRAFLALLISPQDSYELPILTALISHLHSSNVQLNLVALNLFRTLIQLYSEDVMMTLIFQYLTPCNHVMLSQKSKLSLPPILEAGRILDLLPSVCQCNHSPPMPTASHSSTSSNSVSASPSTEPMNVYSPSFSVYLREAQVKVAVSRNACQSWTWLYNAQSPHPTDAVQLITAARLLPITPYSGLLRYNSGSNSLPYETSSAQSDLNKSRSMSLPGYISKKSLNSTDRTKSNGPGSHSGTGKIPFYHSSPHAAFIEDEVRLDSLGESSGYESFNLKSSRDSSPLHNNKTKSQTAADSCSSRLPSVLSFEEENSSQPSGKQDIDNGFLNFLEESEVQSLSTQCDDDLEFIDDFFNFVEEVDSSSHNTNMVYDEEELDIQSLNLAPSTTTDEESTEDNKEISSHPKPSIGPFLEALISKIDNMFSSNMEISLLAMACLSCLASYPCPILTSLLLQPSVVLQPAVRSLFQVLSQIKTKIDKIMTTQDLDVFSDARQKLAQSIFTESEKTHAVSNTQFCRETDKRKSFSQTVSNFFKRIPTPEKNSRRESLLDLPDGVGYKYINSTSNSPKSEAPSPFVSAPLEKRQAALCAVLLQEWLFELASLAEEHTVVVDAIEFTSLPHSS